jgi:carboxymethylenebutenolidase
VTFYGSGIFRERTPTMPALIGGIPEMRTPWLGLYGDADRGIPVEEVEELREALGEGAGVPWEIVRYPGAEHGFHCDVRDSYAPVAAADGWGRTLAWLDAHLETRPH